MNNKTPMVVVMQDGEEIHGVIEWYDRGCLKVNRSDLPNLLVVKRHIKYMYKENESEKEEPDELPEPVDSDEDDE